MGQRLVVEVKRSKRRLATVYFHWSAYTKIGIEILNLMNTHVFQDSYNLSDNELILRLIRFSEKYTSLGYCETDAKAEEIKEQIRQLIEERPPLCEYYEMLALTGGVHPNSLATTQSLFPGESFKQIEISRNAGLVSINDNDMESALNWAECIIEVDLDSKKVLNGLVYEYTIAGYMHEAEEYDENFLDPDDLPKSPIALDEFTVDEIVVVNDVLAIEEGETWIRFYDKIYQTIR
jgi:hypothetical protein